MIPQFGRIVTVSVMVILVALFTWIYQRDHQRRIRLWMTGWAAILLHFIAALLDSFHLLSPPFADWMALCTLIAAAASFLVSVCPSCATGVRRQIFIVCLLIPALLYGGLLSLDVHSALVYSLILAILWGAASYLAWPTLSRNRPMNWLATLLLFITTLWTALRTTEAPEYGFDLILFCAFACTAFLFGNRYRRATPGIVLTVASFLLWGLVFPLGSLAYYLHAGIPADHVIWDLPKYAVAFGMILLLFENSEELLRVEIAERKQAEDRAIAASGAKSQFLANMSHEIRTPMNGIVGLTDLMIGSDDVTTSQREHLELMQASAQALSAVIDDILDFSEIEAGKLSLDQTEFTLQELIPNVIRIMRLRAEQKGLTLTSRIEPNTPLPVLGDPLRLRQVLLNLLSNAIKFTERGAILVEVKQKATTIDNTVHLAFRVIDSGIGIPMEKQSTIFQPFEQADVSVTRKFGGSGLGLTIASELVRLMGGELGVESRANRGGSVFSFQICLKAKEEQIATRTNVSLDSGLPCVPPSIHSGVSFEEATKAIRSLHILLAEDNTLNQLVARRLLEKQGHAVAVAANGRIAITAFDSDHFDVILMDVQMPEMDGIRTTRMIRERERLTGGHIPIIAVTAIATRGDIDACLEAGMDDYVIKPIKSEALMVAIRNTLARFDTTIASSAVQARVHTAD